MLKPLSQPCLRNQDPIYQTLKLHFTTSGHVLELACGTAQHAVYFAERLAHLNWQPSDLAFTLDGAKLWVEEAALENLQPAIMVDINESDWGVSNVDYIYSANLIHFVSQNTVNAMFAGVSKYLKHDGLFALYGPCNQGGYTSEGNACLDQWLKTEINPDAGIKELSDIIALGKKYDLTLIANHLMPANNHLLMFRKETFA
ncbi:MAG: cyclopropane fatty-acyl-phospholipid synthase-like methyltransferase [Oleiphilaceae bacterium]|jgi:cyclopropane fatty-acyl-phospholipid synthase-like methyltransferase